MITFSFVTAMIIALGGALGTFLRYILLLFFAEWHCQQPWALIGINTLGCLLMGYMAGLVCPTTRWIQFVSIGLLGGFTTFSSFAAATCEIAFVSSSLIAILYAIFHPTVGIVAFVLGRMLGGMSIF